MFRKKREYTDTSLGSLWFSTVMLIILLLLSSKGWALKVHVFALSFWKVVDEEMFIIFVQLHEFQCALQATGYLRFLQGKKQKKQRNKKSTLLHFTSQSLRVLSSLTFPYQALSLHCIGAWIFVPRILFCTGWLGLAGHVLRVCTRR